MRTLTRTTSLALLVTLNLAGCSLVQVTEAPCATDSNCSSDFECQNPADGGVGLCAPRTIFVESATFKMGSDESFDSHYVLPDDTRPLTEVALDSYRIDRTQVTAGAYDAWCARKGGDCAPSSSCSHNTGIKYPMSCVTRAQAEAYCTDNGGRLPTEAEWEYAARGKDGRRSPWGDQPCWDDGSGRGVHDVGDRASPVGVRPQNASPFGVQDMIGSVSEWVADYYGPYPGGNQVNWKQTAVNYGVLRGARNDCYVAYRLAQPVESASTSIGFRCARAAKD